MTGPSPAVVAKAGRYIADNRVAVDVNDQEGDVFVGLVHGTAAHPYAVAHGPSSGWSCTCQARTTCSHILACMFIHEEDPS